MDEQENQGHCAIRVTEIGEGEHLSRDGNADKSRSCYRAREQLTLFG